MHLPKNYEHNTVAYTGTHDNNTTRGWFEALPDSQKQIVRNYLGRSSDAPGGVTSALINTVWSSPAALAIAPLQDLLDLGAEARMNVPGRAEGNWQWRSTEDMLSGPAFNRLSDLTRASGRQNNLAANAGAAGAAHCEPISSTVN
jgi:4-alpha-glucanotransferase